MSDMRVIVKKGFDFGARKVFLILGVLALSMGCVTTADTANQSPTTSKIYVMGDVPYKAEEYDKLSKDLSEMSSSALFAVHVGDIKPGAWPCTETIYKKVSDILKTSPIPVFSLPGDNEWNDCTLPEPAWEKWQRYFLRIDQNWQSGLRAYRSIQREENFSIVENGTLFVGVNVVGGKVHDKDEWRRRHAEDLSWIQQNLDRFGEDCHTLVIFGHALPTPRHLDLFGPLTTRIANWGKPALYIHGDGHRWIQDHPFPNAPNLLRIQVDQGGIAPPLALEITGQSEQPFLWDRRLN